MVKTMNARRAGRCDECGGPIAVGEPINYGGPGAVTHGSCRPLAAVRGYRGRVTVRGGVDATGRRCIDAPCCGCC